MDVMTPRESEAWLSFYRTVDAANTKFLEQYQAAHFGDPPNEVEAFRRGFLEANSMWLAVMIMRTQS